MRTLILLLALATLAGAHQATKYRSAYEQEKRYAQSLEEEFNEAFAAAFGGVPAAGND